MSLTKNTLNTEHSSHHHNRKRHSDSSVVFRFELPLGCTALLLDHQSAGQSI
jgi:hypothetical protein